MTSPLSISNGCLGDRRPNEIMEPIEDAVEELIPKFYQQVQLFQHLGTATVSCMESVKVMQHALKGFNGTILELCETDWSKYDHFKNVLKDSVDLYSLLEEDIAKLGNGFQQFGEYFHLVLEAREARKELQIELSNVRGHVERVYESDRAPIWEKEEAYQMLKEKEKESVELDNLVVQRIENLQINQKLFLYNHYRKFVSAHRVFCQECLIVQDIIDDCLQDFLPRKKKDTVEQSAIRYKTV
ncbi:unnamed protein product [Mytilus coruscus]|uniref:Uncharacterized protein n=1 Tax=Mytilus coruscus TaxID=42192 RepID=A0A6J8A1E9_MYTCO|nr:unnamed protein product [Mytilus coruscus]